jgi:hypothetical protein
VVKLVQAADAGAPGVEPDVAVGDPAAVGVPAVGAAVVEGAAELGLAGIVIGPACGRQPASTRVRSNAVEIVAAAADGLPITPLLGPDFWSLHCPGAEHAKTALPFLWR